MVWGSRFRPTTVSVLLSPFRSRRTTSVAAPAERAPATVGANTHLARTALNARGGATLSANVIATRKGMRLRTGRCAMSPPRRYVLASSRNLAGEKARATYPPATAEHKHLAPKIRRGVRGKNNGEGWVPAMTLAKARACPGQRAREQTQRVGRDASGWRLVRCRRRGGCQRGWVIVAVVVGWWSWSSRPLPPLRRSGRGARPASARPGKRRARAAERRSAPK